MAKKIKPRARAKPSTRAKLGAGQSRSELRSTSGLGTRQAKKEISPKKDLETIKENLEKTGEAVGDLFKGLFRGVGKILDVVQEMEQKGEQVRTYRKEIKGFTKSGKEFRGEAGWRIKTGLLGTPPREKESKKAKIRGESN